MDVDRGTVEKAGKVTFLLAAWNAEHDIAPFVDAYRRLSWPDKELVLCAGGHDSTWSRALEQSGPDIQVVEQLPRDGKQVALRKAYTRSSGYLVYLTDIDCRPNDRVVEPMVFHLLHSDADAVTGSNHPLDDQLSSRLANTQWAVDRWDDGTEERASVGLNGSNCVVMASTLHRAGAFTAHVRSGTDYVLAKQLLAIGASIRFVPQCEMPTRYAGSLRGYVRMQSRWLRNVFAHGHQHGAFAEVIGVARTLCLAWAIVLGLLGGALRRPIPFVVAALLLIRAVMNRMKYQRRCGLPLDPAGAAIHVVATQLSALWATIRLLREDWSW